MFATRIKYKYICEALNAMRMCTVSYYHCKDQKPGLVIPCPLHSTAVKIGTTELLGFITVAPNPKNI